MAPWVRFLLPPPPPWMLVLVGNGQWAMGNGRRVTGDGQWAAGDGSGGSVVIWQAKSQLWESMPNAAMVRAWESTSEQCETYGLTI